MCKYMPLGDDAIMCSVEGHKEESLVQMNNDRMHLLPMSVRLTMLLLVEFYQCPWHESLSAKVLSLLFK